MLNEQIIEVESRVPGLLVVHIFLKLVIFLTKQKSPQANLRVNDLILKMLQKTMYLNSPDQAKSQNLNPECKILNGRDFFNWLSNLKNLFFQISLKTCEMRSKWH